MTEGETGQERSEPAELPEPSDTPQQAYWVDLAIIVNAATPEEAVDQFIEGVIQGNLRDWAYGVRDEAGSLLGVFDGFGSPITRDDIARQATEADGEEAERQDADAAEDAADDDDEHLLSLATRLNQAQQD